ncbi:hypothetical protein TSOC_001218 [Tetrabaena socialis]|uniref:Uncharacterized protein n=1 Tax=Tetrabaena socialis TaxID=47790 RepID=A0A2J8AH86_9CHLO|nr:hypothetical protein TSOC_001218 [Tetrabaena socialis]|eukprot:PNH11887.1 hypothetical protein TSOC_001218 [Tetrabaena socialis]
MLAGKASARPIERSGSGLRLGRLDIGPLLRRRRRRRRAAAAATAAAVPCAQDLRRHRQLEPQAGLSRHLNAILQPVRDHFENSAEAKELLKKVKSYKVTK